MHGTSTHACHLANVAKKVANVVNKFAHKASTVTLHANVQKKSACMVLGTHFANVKKSSQLATMHANVQKKFFFTLACKVASLNVEYFFIAMV